MPPSSLRVVTSGNIAVSKSSRLRSVLIALLFVLLAGLLFGASVLIGFKGPKPGFQWELAAVAGTAIGTIALAAATGWLAYSTRSDVRATWELARLTARDQAERERPVVLLAGTAYLRDPRIGERGRLDVNLRNVGLGPALRVEVAPTYEDKGTFAFNITPNPLVVPAISPGEMVTVAFAVSFTKTPTRGIRADGFPISGTYTDRSRRGGYSIITDWDSDPDTEIA